MSFLCKSKLASPPIIALAGMLAASSSIAAPTINWDGFYLGGYIGGAWGNANLNTNVGHETEQSYFFESNVSTVNQYGSGNFSPNAFIGGMYVGNNWVFPSGFSNVVLGPVLDFGSFDLDVKNNASNVLFPDSGADNFSIHTAMNTNWLFTARGRIGLLPTPWALIYASGGLAVTRLHVSNAYTDSTQGIGGNSDSNTKTGWTAGAGFELPLMNNLTINSEYLYVNFGSVPANSGITCANGTCSAFVSPFVTSAKLTANLFKVGVKYNFC